MLVQQTLDKLEAMGLSGMARAMRQQLEQSQYLELSFEERLGLLVDREAETREDRRLQLRLKAAKLRQSVSVEEIDFRAPRALDRSLVLSLAQATWVEAHHNLLITGPTDCGKSFVACALAQAAIRRGHTALYVRAPTPARRPTAGAWRRPPPTPARPAGQGPAPAPRRLHRAGSGRRGPRPPRGHRRPQPAPLHHGRQPAPGGALAPVWCSRSSIERCQLV